MIIQLMQVLLRSPFNEAREERGWNTEAVLRDYRIACRSRQCTIVGRREVYSGKAKFGIFGDGKESAQLALAYAFRKGDFRSGYYRDQTLMFALDLLTVEQFFAQLYAHADVSAEPSFGGRSMTGHFATRLLDDDGNFLTTTDRYNSAADLSPTASQMPKLVGLAYASKLYRRMPELKERAAPFSSDGNEVVFGTIGNAGCAEGLFWEAVNAVGVLQVPMLLSVWDDGFGISVPNAFQMTKGDISRILEGFKHRVGGRPGIDIYVARGWNYPELCSTYIEAAELVRHNHTPAIIHVTELTQPFGHSTSGNHERYKSEDRLAWEREFDCLRKMREWVLERGFATPQELDEIEASEEQAVLEARARAWEALRSPIEAERKTVLSMFEAMEGVSSIAQSLSELDIPLRRDIMAAATEALIATKDHPVENTAELRRWKQEQADINQRRYGSHLYSESEESALKVPVIPARYSENPTILKGFEILSANLDEAFKRIPHLIAFGEDVGHLGGVNQGWAHLQEKYGMHRVSDTGIREATIVGQAIGMALRGLRPMAEIQYLDYLLYALQIIADDLANLRWRTHGGQKAPVIVRTRGHRLEGIWHSGSPMSGIINLVRGLYVCVPRNAVQASGFYNTLLRSDDAALVVETLNEYRRKEAMPDNIGEFTLPLGVPETLRAGSDVTVVTYGACCEIALRAAALLESIGISIEIIDVQTLLPFDLHGSILESIKKTNRVLFLDEDCPGGATAYMLQETLERQGGFQWLDAPPRTLSAKPHRPAYGSDGDYFSKPNREQIVETVYEMMRESAPEKFPQIL
ncbi:MAG TPA: transketolase C-terminal domain-containing protein [Terriglobia bacterium]|nr:transketolase C-terminal domain-containing protein [Terriglobia bacterium]